MAMLEIRNVQKTFRTYAKPGLSTAPVRGRSPASCPCCAA